MELDQVRLLVLQAAQVIDSGGPKLAKKSELYVTESRKTVPNHTFLFQNIYYCNMNNIISFTLFHKIT